MLQSINRSGVICNDFTFTLPSRETNIYGGAQNRNSYLAEINFLNGRIENRSSTLRFESRTDGRCMRHEMAAKKAD